MSTIVTIQVREQRPDFRGVIALTCVAGDGSPEHFAYAVREALKQASENLPGVGVMPAHENARSIPA